jgi:hypothetical protein
MATVWMSAEPLEETCRQRGYSIKNRHADSAKHVLNAEHRPAMLQFYIIDALFA